MTEGPLGGPRPLSVASLNASFTFNAGADVDELALEDRLRNNGFSRANVRVDESNTDSRTKVSVVTEQEKISIQMVKRLVGQVKDEVDGNISDRNIDIFCT